MSRKAKVNIRETISPYLTRLASKNTATEPKKSDAGESSKSVKMAPPEKPENTATVEVSNTDLQKLLVNMDAKMDKNFEEMNSSITKLTDKVESLECDVDVLRKRQETDHNNIDTLTQRMEDLSRSLLFTQRMSRKYNLILHGVDGYETEAEKTIERVREFALEDLEFEESYVKNLAIRNAHRLKKRDDGRHTPIIVVFLKWSDRDKFLSNNPTLKEKNMRVTPDLPPALKKIRGTLAAEAFRIRQEENLHARVRDKGVDFWIETRTDAGDKWRRRVISIADVASRRQDTETSEHRLGY